MKKLIIIICACAFVFSFLSSCKTAEKCDAYKNRNYTQNIEKANSSERNS